MSEPFLAEIRICPFNFAPKGWAMCNGQQMPINQNQALFSLLGTTFGGNGQTTFALPDFRGRMPVHVGNGINQGQQGGQEAVTLSQFNLPAHTHAINGRSAVASTGAPGGATVGAKGRFGRDVLGPADGSATLADATVSNVGGSQAHNNMQPYLALNFIIALQGIFPSPT